MTRQTLRRLIAQALGCEGILLKPVVTRAPDAFGDWTSNAPHQAARLSGRAPDEIGQTLISRLAPNFPGRVELKGGRLNFFMSDDFLSSTLDRAARDGAHFGAGESLAGQRVLVEYVSSDPTGPLPFTAGRHAALGEAICRLLENQGARVTREFYLNDATSSSKIRLLGESVANWYLEAFGRGRAGLDGGLSDPFVRGVGAELARRDGAKWLDSSEEERISAASSAALESAIATQKATLEQFGVRFDEWTSEATLRREGRVEFTLNRLQERGFTYEKDGALWLQTSKFGDESDRVLKRSNGEYTYFAGDIAYHIWKSERGFDLIINIWGAEHKTYIPRTKAALQAAGCDSERFEFIVCEGVQLKRDGSPLRLGSGGGPLLLEEELKEIDADTLKFFFLRPDATKTADIELEIAQRDDETNPAYAAQLVPSRLARLGREAQGQIHNADIVSRSPEQEIAWSDGERELARLVAMWPDEAQEAAARRAPARIVQFLLELSDTTRTLLSKSAPSTAPLPHRLQLLRAAGNAASGALRMLSIETREKF